MMLPSCSSSPNQSYLGLKPTVRLVVREETSVRLRNPAAGLKERDSAGFHNLCYQLRELSHLYVASTAFKHRMRREERVPVVVRSLEKKISAFMRFPFHTAR